MIKLSLLDSGCALFLFHHMVIIEFKMYILDEIIVEHSCRLNVAVASLGKT